MDWYSGLIVAKDPDAKLNWRWDWTDWLADGETVSTHDVTTPAGITKDGSADDSTGVNVVLSGGTIGTSYAVTVEITTTPSAYKAQRTVTFEVSEQ